jgi:hypothetical protein
MHGLNMFLSFTGANSVKNIAQHIPMGTPMTAAPNVTANVPTIIGNIPNLPWLGDHSIPNTNSKKPTDWIIGAPWIKMNPVINANAEIEERAQSINIQPGSFSKRTFIV